jgi:hypothetical protein
VAVFAGFLLGLPGLWPFAALVLVTDGWSRAGADGGGFLMLAAAFVVLWLRLRRTRPTFGRAAAGVVAVAALAAALVGIDAATGGSSHVTRAVRRGPGYLVGELGHRIHLSAAGVAANWHTALVFALAVVALAYLVSRGPRFAAGDALVAGIAVSLVVNDTPTDVAAAGAVSYGVLWAWRRVGTEPRASPTAASVPADAPRLVPRA